MGFGHRMFLVLDDDRVIRVPSARFGRIHDGDEMLPEYAGQRVRCADIMVQLEERQLTGWYREWYYLLPFDRTGRVDRDEVLRGAALAMDANPLLLYTDQRVESSNVVDSRGRFAKARLTHEHRWEPGHQLRKRLLDLALGRQRRGGQ